MLKVSVIVTIRASEQQEIFEVYSDLVDFSSELANSHPTALVEIEDIDPAKLLAEE